MTPVDLRSDTVTRPTPGMRQAIAAAEVGDDVLGDDPTVIRLQERAAELLGKPAALYVPSGTMANQVAIRSVCEHGDELIIDETTHAYHYETGAPAALSGVSVRIIRSPRGIFTASDVDACVRPRSAHFANSRLVIVENTNNRGGGAVWSVDQVAAVRRAADGHDLHLHLDGARLMNACTARNVKPAAYTQHVHSVSMCFSKGLGAPVGSIVAGERAFIERAHRFRKMFGGAMRQSGLLAAAALYALDHHVDRLREDHDNARHFAEAISELPGIILNPADVESNICIFRIDPALGTADEFTQRLRERGVWMFSTGADRARAVTHLDVSRQQIDQAIRVFRDVCNTSIRAAAAAS
ncbi:MAG: aminotransferase class I/II-fold pyridoxal phosphate-dependent enzyme [Phycisphaerales bacterium]|nr:aminotransferase class I/II-fold pyridoxal phosphate-dependent enzyme [Phycisphaerales bacterium]